MLGTVRSVTCNVLHVCVCYLYSHGVWLSLSLILVFVPFVVVVHFMLLQIHLRMIPRKKNFDWWVAPETWPMMEESQAEHEAKRHNSFFRGIGAKRKEPENSTGGRNYQGSDHHGKSRRY